MSFIVIPGTLPVSRLLYTSIDISHRHRRLFMWLRREYCSARSPDLKSIADCFGTKVPEMKATASLVMKADLC